MKNQELQTLYMQGQKRLNSKHRNLPAAEREEVLQDSLIDYMAVVERGGRVDNPAAFLAVIIDRTAATAATKLTDLRAQEVPAGGFDELATIENERRPDQGDYSAASVPEFTADDQLFTTAFDQALRSMPPLPMQAFIAVELRGLSQDEAAPILGISQPTLSRRLAEARDYLREAIG